MAAPDRTNDVPPPSHGTQHQCKCGKLMIPRTDFSNSHQGYATWHWWCGCGEVADGGKWHPQTADEALKESWERHNRLAGAAAAGAAIPANCAHVNKTVADGGWTCDDCGRVGTIASLGDHMLAMPPAWRRTWCDDIGSDTKVCPGTGCTCANGAGKLAFWGFTKEQWQAWCAANPTAAQILPEVIAAHEAEPNADNATLVAKVMAKFPGMENIDVVRGLVFAHVAAHGVQQDIPTHH